MTHIAPRGFIEQMWFNAILAHHGETRGCIMTVWLKIRRRKLGQDHGHHDVGSCPLFASDLDASESSDLHQTGGRQHDRGIMAHDHRSIAVVHRSSLNWIIRDFCWLFLIKYRCSSLCILTSDQIVKQLSDFWGRSWVHHDSLAFTLNHDLIEAGFIMFNCWIRSNSPLER